MPKLQQSWVNPSILRHSGIEGAADEAVLNIVHRRNKKKSSCKKSILSVKIAALDSLNRAIGRFLELVSHFKEAR
jgi:hypothetical protein